MAEKMDSIMVELDFDTKGMEQAAKAADQAGLVIGAALDSSYKGAAELQKQFVQLATTMTKQKAVVDELAEKYESLKNKNGNNKNVVKEAAKELASAQEEYKKTAQAVTALTGKMAANAQAAALENDKREMAIETLELMGKAATKTLQTIATAVQAGVNAYKDWEKAQQHLQGTARKTGVTMAELNAASEKLSSDGLMSPQQANEAIGNLLKYA